MELAVDADAIAMRMELQSASRSYFSFVFMFCVLPMCSFIMFVLYSERSIYGSLLRSMFWSLGNDVAFGRLGASGRLQ